MDWIELHQDQDVGTWSGALRPTGGVESGSLGQGQVNPGEPGAWGEQPRNARRHELSREKTGVRVCADDKNTDSCTVCAD